MPDFRIPIRVYHEDTDAGGIVYYANYLRFMERARTEFLRAAGFEQDVLLEQEKLMFVVTAADIKYRAPAVFNDRLSVSAVPQSCGRASMRFGQTVYRLHGDDEQVACEATVSLACLNSDSLKPARVPAKLLDALSFGSTK